MCNSGPTPLSIPRNSNLGLIEMVPWEGIKKVDQEAFVSAVNKNCHFPIPPISEKDRKFVFDNLQMTVPDSEIAAYKELIEKNHDIFSKNDQDIGLANNFEHRVFMKIRTQCTSPNLGLLMLTEKDYTPRPKIG